MFCYLQQLYGGHLESIKKSIRPVNPVKCLSALPTSTLFLCSLFPFFGPISHVVFYNSIWVFFLAGVFKSKDFIFTPSKICHGYWYANTLLSPIITIDDSYNGNGDDDQDCNEHDHDHETTKICGPLNWSKVGIVISRLRGKTSNKSGWCCTLYSVFCCLYICSIWCRDVHKSSFV